MEKEFDRKIILASGEEFYGYGFGSQKETINEIVFNTSMVGYQEIISDPSYTGQCVVMTYPIIGNYGITDEDFETKIPTMGGLIVRKYNDNPSNFRYTKTLSEILEESNIPGIEGIDTRKITRIIRDFGSQNVMITAADTPLDQALIKIRAHRYPADVVSQVSCKKKWYARTTGHKFDVVAVDCGIKRNIICELNKKGCNVTVVPYNISSEEIIKMQPDGLFLSNGPGNPENVTTVINLVKSLKGKLPIFGICLGYQMICLSYGAKTYKLKFGHRGGNHPVKEIATGKIDITSQNHSYAVDVNSLEKTGLTLTHINLLDNTAEGVICERDKVFAVQYHPESSPGPQDSAYLFDRFISAMKG